MAKNKTHDDKRGTGKVKSRARIENPLAGTWWKRDDKSGKFMEVKADPKPFRGVRKAKGR